MVAFHSSTSRLLVTLFGPSRRLRYKILFSSDPLHWTVLLVLRPPHVPLHDLRRWFAILDIIRPCSGLMHMTWGTPTGPRQAESKRPDMQVTDNASIPVTRGHLDSGVCH